MDKKFVENIKYKLFLNFFRLIIPILLYSYLYRIFNVEIMGKINFSESYYSLFNSIAILGIYEFGIRELSRFKSNSEKFNKSIVNILLVNLISLSITLFIYIYVVFKYQQGEKILVLFIFKLILLLFNLDWINEALEEYKFISLKTIFCRIIIVILTFLCVKYSTDYLIYITLNILFDFLLNIGSIIYILKNKRIKLKIKYIDYSNIKKIFKGSMLIFFLTQSSLLFFQYDKVYLGKFFLKQEVAYYSICEKIIMILISLVLTIIQVTFPRLSYYKEKHFEQYKKLLNEIINYNILLLFPAIIGAISLRKEILFLFGGNKYIEAETIFMIFSLYILLYFMVNILAYQVLFLYDYEKIVGVIAIFYGLVNILLKFVLKRYINGAEATITVTVICQLFLCISLYIFMIRKKIDVIIIPFKTIGKALISSIIFYEVIKKLREALSGINVYIFLVLSVIVAIVIYFTTLLILKEENILKFLSRKGIDK